MTVSTADGSETRNVAPGCPRWAERPWHLAQESVVRIQQHWVDCLGAGTEPATSGHDNLRTLALVEAAYASAASGEAVVPGRGRAGAGRAMTTMRSEPIPRRKLYHEVVDRLRERILSGEYGPGEQMPSERQLMELFQVGRPAIREAMLTLERMGMIAISHGERARALRPTAQSVIDQVADAARCAGAPDRSAAVLRGRDGPRRRSEPHRGGAGRGEADAR